MYLFEGDTADEVWIKAASKFGETEGVRRQPSRAGETLELIGAAFTIRNPRQRWVVSRQPAMNPAFALAEVVWIVKGRKDAAFLNYWNPKLPKYAGTGRQYHGAYGNRLRRHFKVDQLDRAYKALLNNPDSRQVVLQIWDSSVDFPAENGAPVNTDIPCNVCSFAKIRDGRLEWTQILRSNDLFLGVPHNFVQFTSLQEILAGWLGVEVGHYRHIADCLHVYDRDTRHINDLGHLAFEPNTDVLRLSKTDSDEAFEEVESCMNQMLTVLLSEKKLRKLTKAPGIPKELQNWLLVIAADCARRHNWISLSYEFMAECSNPGLRQLWERWLARWWVARREEAISQDAAIFAQPWLPLRFCS